MKKKWVGLAQPTRTLGLSGAHTGPDTLVRAALKSILPYDSDRDRKSAACWKFWKIRDTE